MTWFLYRLVAFIAVYSNGTASEFYQGRETRVNNNRVAFERANGNTSNVKFRYKGRRVTQILWEVE